MFRHLRLAQARRALRRPRCPAAARYVSSSSNPFPFPTAANPTPYQIFHLPPTATRDDVKARYYDLVRIYHPDSAVSRAVAPETAHARFQAVSAAYAVLSGKAQRMADAADGGAEGARPDYHSLSTAMWRARQRKRAELNVGTIDDWWKDAVMLGAVLLSIGVFVWQTHSARLQAMSAAQEQPSYRTSPSSRSARRPEKTLDLDESSLAEPTVEKPPHTA